MSSRPLLGSAMPVRVSVIIIIPIPPVHTRHGSHPFVATTWVVLALYNTMTSHSGYAIPFVGDPLAHDWHHEVCVCWCRGMLFVGIRIVGHKPAHPRMKGSPSPKPWKRKRVFERGGCKGRGVVLWVDVRQTCVGVLGDSFVSWCQCRGMNPLLPPPPHCRRREAAKPVHRVCTLR